MLYTFTVTVGSEESIVSVAKEDTVTVALARSKGLCYRTGSRMTGFSIHLHHFGHCCLSIWQYGKVRDLRGNCFGRGNGDSRLEEVTAERTGRRHAELDDVSVAIIVEMARRFWVSTLRLCFRVQGCGLAGEGQAEENRQRSLHD